MVRIDSLNIQLRFKVKHFGQLQIAFEKIAKEPNVFGRKQAKNLSFIVNETQAQMYQSIFDMAERGSLLFIEYIFLCCIASADAHKA